MRIMWFYSDREHKNKVYVNLNKISYFSDCKDSDDSDPRCVIYFDDGDFVIVHESADDIAKDMTLSRGVV